MISDGDVDILQLGRAPLLDPDYAGTLVLDFQPPYPSAIHFCCFQITQFMVFLHSSQNTLTQFLTKQRP